MAKLTLMKSIEARKLNPKTGVGLPGTDKTIPYGAIIDGLERHRDDARFNYQMELYGCRYQVVEEALDKGAKTDESSGATASQSSAPDKPRLQWEQVAASGPLTLRTKVPGGWLVAVGSGVTFYPDAEHSWDGTSS